VRIFVTGGAGFIGSRFIRAVGAYDDVEILAYDSLLEQVHGHGAEPPDLGPNARIIVADIRDRGALGAALRSFRPTVVVHLASETGTGQSLDEIHRYADVNVTGTAVLLEELRSVDHLPDTFLLASSRAVYGEGPYADAEGSVHYPRQRAVSEMRAGRFAVQDAHGRPMTPLPASSIHNVRPLSVYATTKLTQEHLVENVLGSTGTRTVIFRFQNVYGPGQSLINPYTGVLSIFMGKVSRGESLPIYEDGQITRDFVFVDDVVAAMLAAVVGEARPDRPIDIGSGVSTTILEAARLIATACGRPDTPTPITGEFRVGDIRHAVADTSYARQLLDWAPRTSLSDGIKALHAWAREASGPH